MTSMNRRLREVEKTIAAITDRYEIRTAGKNMLRVTLRGAYHQLSIFAPATPSDHRDLKNLVSETRRTWLRCNDPTPLRP